jgi:hypothetical protein
LAIKDEKATNKRLLTLEVKFGSNINEDFEEITVTIQGF